MLMELHLPFEIASRFVSFPKPKSCESLNTPLDALANEKENNNDTSETDINLQIVLIIISLC